MQKRYERKGKIAMKSVARLLLSTTATVCLLVSPALATGTGHDHGSMPGMSDEMANMMTKMDRQMGDTSSFGHKGESSKATRTIGIEASEIMFNMTALKVGAGETVRFVVSNKGEQPHEFTIGDGTYQELARQMMTHMTEMGMDASSSEHTALHESAGNTVTLGVGETKEIVWTFTKAGAFEFSCNIPGHSEVGMKGAIEVN